MLNVKAVLAVQGLLTHLHTPAASCEILKTEQLPPHSYHILKLRQSNITAQKKPYCMSEINSFKKKKKTPPRPVCTTKHGWYDLQQMQFKQACRPAIHTHTHNDVIYLWLSTRKLAANGDSESPQIWRTHRRTAMLHMPLGNGLLCLNGKNMLSSCW